MPSPFPGMDPYLEEPVLWSTLHQRLITYIADDLNVLLPGLAWRTWLVLYTVPSALALVLPRRRSV